jgi:predicted lipid-binding transport protein (Tim44 family)
LFLVLLAIFALVFLSGAVRTARARKHRAARVRRVELASAEAAAEDQHFGADTVKREAGELFGRIMAAWTARDRDALRASLGDDLMVEWERRLDDFDRKGWHNVTTVEHGPSIEYVGLVNRAQDQEDRVVVRVESTLRDVVRDRHGATITRSDSRSELTTLAEYWTLGKRDGGWILLSIEQDAEGSHHLAAPIVASPWGDEARLRDEAVTELATADAVPEEAIAGLADLDFDGTARAAALDLATIDGRFAPAVLEAAARRAVEAWAEAVDGDDAALLRVASVAAARELLHPGDPSARTRLVVRGPRLRALRISALHADARPPAMTVEADVTGRRYVEDRDTVAVLRGSKERETTFTERWTMTLDGDPGAPWRIAAAGAPSAAR